MNLHSTKPLTAFTRAGSPCAVVYTPVPNPPHCPMPQASKSVFGIKLPSMRSTVKNVKSPPRRVIYQLLARIEYTACMYQC